MKSKIPSKMQFVWFKNEWDEEDNSDMSANHLYNFAVLENTVIKSPSQKLSNLWMLHLSKGIKNIQ